MQAECARCGGTILYTGPSMPKMVQRLLKSDEQKQIEYEENLARFKRIYDGLVQGESESEILGQKKLAMEIMDKLARSASLNRDVKRKQRKQELKNMQENSNH